MPLRYDTQCADTKRINDFDLLIYEKELFVKRKLERHK